MFNLNENNRIVMAQHPTDMRMGVNCLSGQVRIVGLDPSNGDVYIREFGIRDNPKKLKRLSNKFRQSLFIVSTGKKIS